MNWSRGLFRAWVLGSTLWLLGWSAHLLLEWPAFPAETAACEAVIRKAPTEPLTDDEMKCFAFLRLTDWWGVISPLFPAAAMRYDNPPDQRIQDVYPDDYFILTESYIETFIENPALNIEHDRTLMLRFELKSPRQYRADVLSHFFNDIQRENVSNHRENLRNQIVTTTVAAFGIPAISFVLGWASLWVGHGFKRD